MPLPPADDPRPESPEAAPENALAEDDGLPPAPLVHRVLFWILGVYLIVIVFGVGALAATGNLDRLTRSTPQPEPEPEPEAEIVENAVFSFASMAEHPHQKYWTYLATVPENAAVNTSTAERLPAFHALLDLYRQRQSDDNFSLRIVDKRTMETLELYEMTEERAAYEASGVAEFDWYQIDRKRRTLTNQLVSKWVAKGVPRPDIGVRWGRRNQIVEARMRDMPFIGYEVRLAQMLGMSLLSTELGTVETFNSDRLVSSVGARGRYQMMPQNLRIYGLNQYDLKTTYGNTVAVYEEWHPLFSMVPSFMLMRGYINAVGHEIPGLSAYHTGPGNIFSLYRAYLDDAVASRDSFTTVMDAYVWGVTDGFEQVSKKTSFKTYSRGYIPSAYGALRVTETMDIDPSTTWEVMRLRMKSGTEMPLSELLDALKLADASLAWGGMDRSLTMYERFRRLNQHMDLPPASASDEGVPPEGNVVLRHSAAQAPVRFFLPIGAATRLREAGLDVIDPTDRFVFNSDTYRLQDGDITGADRAYAQLVEDIRWFGFTDDNRRRLFALVPQFEQLAEVTPSPFRTMQLTIIKQHKSVWQSRAFTKLSQSVALRLGDGTRPGTREARSLPEPTAVPAAPLTPLPGASAFRLGE